MKETSNTRQKNMRRTSFLFGAISILITTSQVFGQGPVQPEAMQFEPVDVTDVVNLATGDFVYTIPLMNVPGPEGDYPIVLSYHSRIGPNQPATWVGLGWTLNPGAINRVLNGYPDDYDGEVVKTVYQSKGKKHHGVSLSGGWGPVGLNLSYNTHSGFGINMMAQIELGKDFGASVSVGTGGANLGLGYNIGAANLDIGVSAGAQGITTDLSASFNNNGVRNPDNITIGSTGASISTSKNGTNFNVAGVGFQSTGSPSKGYVTGFSVGIPIIFPTGLWFNIGYSQHQWNLYDVSIKNSYGALYQNDTNNERYKSGNLIYPSNDFFMVSTQGLTGTMKINYREAFVIKDHNEPSNKGHIVLEHDQYNFDSNVNPIFRFEGDKGMNMLSNNIDAPWGENYNRFDETVYNSKKIDPVLDGGTIIGFEITDTDGMVYEFKKPSFNHFQYSESIIDESSTLTNLNSLNGTFATTWFVTAIKGSDYVDRGTEGIDENDWGYWVKFEYETQESPQIWRAPYDGYAPGSRDNVTHFNLGLRDVSYLKSISTKTHTAIFDINELISLNNISPQFSTNNNINPTAGNLNASGQATFKFKGNFDWIDDPQNTNDILKVYHVYGRCEIFFERQYCNLAGFYGDNNYYNLNEINLQYSETTHHTSITVNVPFRNYTKCSDISDPEYEGFCYAGTNAEIILNNVVQSGLTSSKVLSNIELYNKSDLSEEVKIISFDYDYHLRPKTKGSIANVSDGAEGGSLTLNAIHFTGQNNYSIAPPYRFEYANGDNPGAGLNPEYHSNDWDHWGSYRDPGSNGWDRGFRKHNTPQDKTRADRAAAWALTGITTPTGSVVEVEYESDDYLYVNDTYEFWESLKKDFGNSSVIGNTIHFSNNNVLNQLETGQIAAIALTINTTRTVVFNNGSGKRLEREISSESVESLPEIYHIQSINMGSSSLTFDQSVDVNLNEFENNLSSNSTITAYHILFARNKTFGGGSRVASISTIDGSSYSKTIYNYEKNGKSTGVTSTLHNKYGIQEDVEAEIPRKYRQSLLDHDLAFGRPSPGILYSKVQVLNVDDSGNPVSGLTEFEFYTAKDYPFDVELSSEETEITINDRSGIYGKPKAITYYEQIYTGGDYQFRPIRKSTFQYAFSDKLPNSADVFYNNNGNFGNVSGLANKPLGMIQQKYISHNEVTNGEWKTTKVDRIKYNVFDVGRSNTEYFYDTETRPNASSVRSTRARTIGFDMHTGQPLVTVSQSSSEDEVFINRTTPAWWKYSGLEYKNMLTQVFENTTYKASADIDQIPDLLSYNYPGADVLASTVTTWASTLAQQFTCPGCLPELVSIWRKNDTYEYVGTEDYTPFPSSYKSYNQDAYKFPESGKPWEMTSNVVQYDNFGHVTESVNKDGTYNAVIYDQENNSLVKAVADNAKLSEVVYNDFETGNSSDAHTGEKSRNISWTSATLATAPGASPAHGGKYKASMWIKNTAQVSINGKLVEPSDGKWQLVQMLLNNGQSLYLSNSGTTKIDDIVIAPIYSTVSYFAYDPLTWKVTAMTGPDHRTTFYEYDDAGRLKLTRDFEGNIISKNKYGYGNELYITRSSDYIETNEALTFTANKQNTNQSYSKYSWSFGDGAEYESFSSNTATHTYGSPGEYDLVLTAKDNEGNTRRMIEKITVGRPLNIVLDVTQNDPEAIRIKAWVNGAVGPVTYLWTRKTEPDNDFRPYNLHPDPDDNSVVKFNPEDHPEGSQIIFKLEIEDASGREKEETLTVTVGDTQ